MDVSARSNVSVTGPEGARPVVFAHGFGCDQSMWRLVAPGFATDHRVVLYDLAGRAGRISRLIDRERYASLEGYADDVLALLRGWT